LTSTAISAIFSYQLGAAAPPQIPPADKIERAEIEGADVVGHKEIADVSSRLLVYGRLFERLGPGPSFGSPDL
jgi:hypothetical protein